MFVMFFLLCIEDQITTYHNFSHDFITATVEFEGGSTIFGRPLQVDDVQRRPQLLRPVHAPQPRISAKDFQA